MENYYPYYRNNINIKEGTVIYWMQRDQRAHDNHALLFAQELALKSKSPLAVCFSFSRNFLIATKKHYSFMLHGLLETKKELLKYNIPFFLLHGTPDSEIPELAQKLKSGVVVTDFNPLKIVDSWKIELASRLDISLIEIDAHNIVPCRIASDKQEYGAYTIRPKIKRKLPEFFKEPETLKQHPFNKKIMNLNEEYDFPDMNYFSEKTQAIPGTKAAIERLTDFVKNQLSNYPSERNNPALKGTSELSPYLHFGQISPLRVALEISMSPVSEEAKEEFLEQLIIRRELADNFCYYNNNYDSFQGFPDWAQKTLDKHRFDKRAYSYSRNDFEQAKTHDTLWNNIQKKLIEENSMHGYLRMYWAKMILQWSETPEEALYTAIYLNDKYQLDGRDPNGYTGIAWSIGGLHDRAWYDRPVTGKIRQMSGERIGKMFQLFL